MTEQARETPVDIGRRLAGDLEAMMTRMFEERAALASARPKPPAPMTEQERLAAAGEFGRQKAAEIEAVMDGICAEAARLGFDGKAALQAVFAGQRSVSDDAAATRPRLQLVWSRIK